MRIISNKVNLKFEDFGSLFDENNPFILNDIAFSDLSVKDVFKSDGFFVYKLSLYLNIKKILDSKISGINIKIINKKDNTQLFSNNVYFSEDISTNSISKDNKSFYKLIGDLKSLKKDFKIADIFSKKPIELDNFDFYHKTKELVAKNYDPSILLNNVKPNFSLPSSELSRSALTKDGRESEQNLRVVDTRKNQKITILQNFRNINSTIYNNKEIRELKNSLKDNDNSQEKNIKITELTKIKNDFLIFNREIEIDKKILSDIDSFYFDITPFTNEDSKNKTKVIKNIRCKSSRFEFFHRKQVLQFSNFITEPKIKCLNNKNGKVTLEVQNQDLFSRKFNLYYKVFNAKTNQLSESKIIDSYNFLPNERKTIEHDSSENYFPNKIFYRVSVLNEGISCKFSTLIVDGIKNTNNSRSNNRNSNLSIIANNEFDGIRIDITNIPKEVLGFRLLREDLGISRENNDRIQVVQHDNHNDVNVTDLLKISYLDKNVINNRKYRYYGMITERLGKSYKSSDDEIIERIVFLDNFKKNIIVTDPQVEKTQDNKVNVNFEIKLENRNNGLEFVLDLLKESGYNEVFISELQKQKTDLNSLVSFLVERVDIISGKRVSLGLTKPGIFVDSYLNEKTSIDLNKSLNYKYIFKLCLNPTDALLPSTKITLKNSRNKNIEVNSKKFRSQKTKRSGVILSERQIREVNTEKEIIDSQVGVEIVKEVSINKNIPSITDLKIFENQYNNFCKINWSVSGDKKDIDYFIVYIDYLNNLLPIGTVSYDGNSSSFMFVDNNYFNEVGNKTYKIRTVYNNFSFSQLSDGISSYKKFNLPENFINNSEFIGL